MRVTQGRTSHWYLKSLSRSFLAGTALVQPALVTMATTRSHLITCAHCDGVVNLVCDGVIPVKNGIDRLVLFRQAGTPEQRTSAVTALQFLACNLDRGIANAAQRFLRERFVDDSWQLFTQYREAIAQTMREYDEVMTAVLLHATAAEVTTTQRNPVPPDTASNHAHDADAGSVESF